MITTCEVDSEARELGHTSQIDVSSTDVTYASAVDVIPNQPPTNVVYVHALSNQTKTKKKNAGTVNSDHYHHHHHHHLLDIASSDKVRKVKKDERNKLWQSFLVPSREESEEAP